MISLSKNNENNSQNKIPKSVLKSFDEFVYGIVKNVNFDFPERKGMTKNRWRNGKKKDFIEIISPNHVYCTQCNEHLYSYTDFTDINSFFQRHINTSHHKCSRLINLLPGDMPMISWEVRGISGRCNVCNISGMNALIFDSGVPLHRLKFSHKCQREKLKLFVNFNRNKEILKMFCSLSLFQEKFVSHENQQTVCLLCHKKLNKSKQSIRQHFVSDQHGGKFFSFVENTLKFKLKDLLNGFHLEEVLRWISSLNLNLNLPKNLQDCWEEKICLKESNNPSFLYTISKAYIQFVPKFIKNLLKIHPEDLIFGNECLLCKQKKINSKHKDSAVHIENLKHAFEILNKNSWAYTIFCKTRQKRLMPYRLDIENYYLYFKDFEKCNSQVASGERKKFLKELENCNFSQMVPCSICAALLEASSSQSYCENCAKLNSFTKLEESFSKMLFNVFHSFENKIIDRALNNKSPAVEKLGVDKIDIQSNSISQENNETGRSAKMKKEQNDSKEAKEMKINGGQSKAKSKSQSKCKVDDSKPVSSEIGNSKEEENKKTSKDGLELVGKEKSEIDNDYEVLIIPNLPEEMQKDSIALFDSFKEFGRIKELAIEKETGTILFDKVGVAQSVVKRNSKGKKKIDLELIFERRKKKFQEYEKLNEEIVGLLEEPKKLEDFISGLISPTMDPDFALENTKKEDLICLKVMSIIRKIHSEACCYKFGSRTTGLYLDGDTDLDLFVDCGGMYDGYRIMSSDALILKVAEIERFMKLEKNNFREIRFIPEARVPILSFVEVETNLKCDLNFHNGLGVRNSHFLKFMMSLDERVKPLILFLKHWLKVNDLHGHFKLNSYAFTLMAIFYLQQLPSPILPAVEILQENYVGRRFTISGWDCSFSVDANLLPKTQNSDSLAKILLGFFEFYASFEYDKYVVSPLTGKPLLRTAFTLHPNTLPTSCKRHFHNLLPGLLQKHFKSIFWVMDPFELSHNVVKGFPKYKMRNFVRFCKSSGDLLRKGIANLEEDGNSKL